jgi:hypothetical protein
MQSEYRYASVPLGMQPNGLGWGKVVTRGESVIYRRVRLLDERKGYCAMMSEPKIVCMDHREHADASHPMPMHIDQCEPAKGINKAGAR